MKLISINKHASIVARTARGLSMFAAFALLLSILASVNTVSAADPLTEDQKYDCYTKFTGKEVNSLGTVNTYLNIPSDEKFADNQCAIQRICQVVSGSTIGCKKNGSGNLVTRIETTPTSDLAPTCADTTKTSFMWNSSGCATTGDLISQILKILALLVGIAVVIGIAWGGMLYATSDGNAGKAQQGVTIIVNAIIGLLLFIFMFALTNFLVPGGILS